MDFTCSELIEGVWQISDNYDNCSTLVVGREKALLFDTMIGIGDLKSFVGTLTELPVTVVNSHGHTDHVGNNCQFDEVYIARSEIENFKDDLRLLHKYTGRFNDPMENTLKSLTETEKYRDLFEGMEFDLGDVTAKAVSLPGHTSGGIGLLIPGKRVLLVGDAISPQMCLFLYGTQTADIYIKTLEKAQRLDFDYIIGGHFRKLFPKRVLDKFMKCALLPQKKRGREYVHSILDDYRGKFYILDPYDEDTECIIMIITK